MDAAREPGIVNARLSMRRRMAAVALAGAAVGSGLPAASPVRAIPSAHEITVNWAGSPTPTNAPFGATRTSEWHINTNDADAVPGNDLVNNVRLQLTATNGVFTSIPAVCKKTGVTPVSAISGSGTQLLCNLGTIREGTATVVQAPLKASSTTGGALSVSGTVSSDSGPAAGPASPPPLPITYTHGMDLVISAPGSYYQAKLEQSRTGGNRFFVDVDYALTLTDGSRPGPPTYTFPLTITGNPAAQLNGLQWEGCATVSAETAALGIPYSDPARADRTNVPTCTITGGPNNYTVTLSGLDYSLVNSPTKDSLGNALPPGKTFIASGTLHFSIPVRTQVLTGVTFTASPGPFTFTDGQTFPQTDATNDTSNTTMIPLGGFSTVWQGGPTRGRSAWDPNLWVAPGTSEGLTFPVPGAGTSTNPGQPVTQDDIPLAGQIDDAMWFNYTGPGGPDLAGGCGIIQNPTAFTPTMLTYYPADISNQPQMPQTMRFFYTTAALNSKTETCGQPIDVPGSMWTELPMACNGLQPISAAYDDGNCIAYLPPGVTAAKMTFDPARDTYYHHYLTIYGFVPDTAPVGAESWIVGAFNMQGNPATTYPGYPTLNGWVNPSTYPGGLVIPGSTYGPNMNGFRDAYRVQAAEGAITKAASDTSAQPGVPVTYTLNASANLAVNNPPNQTFTVVDTLPAGMTYVAGSGSPAPVQSPPGTLTWTFTNVPANVAQAITYQAMLPVGSAVAPGTVLTNVAQVNATGDQRPAAVRQARASVTVPNTSATTLGKSTLDSVLSFYGDASAWQLTINSQDPVTNPFTDTIDVLPGVGDGRGTNISGSYTVTGVTAPAGSSIYYSTAPVAGLDDDPRNVAVNGGANNVGGSAGWTAIAANTPLPAAATAVRVIGPALAPGGAQVIRINYATPAGTDCVTPVAGDNRPGEMLVNSASSVAGHTGLPMLSSATTTIGDCYALDIQKDVLAGGGDPFNPADWHDADTSPDYQQYAAGDTAQYRITVTNKGAALAGVAITDSLYPGCNQIVALAAAGQAPDDVATIFCSGVVGVGATVNTATATVTPPEGPVLTPFDPAGVVVPLPPMLAKTSNPADGGAAAPGQTVTYTITVTEPAGSVAPFPNATLTDDLADVLLDADFVAGSATATDGVAVFNPATQELTWTAATALVPGASVTITYQVMIKPFGTAGTDGELINGVTSPGTNCDPGTAPECSTTVLVPSYEVRKSSAPPAPQAVNPGDTVVYTVEVENTGTVAYTPTITDDLTDVLNDATYQGDAEAASGATTLNAPTVAGGVLSWTGPLAVGETVTITYSVIVNQTFADGVLNNVVTGTGPNNCPTVGAAGPECRTSHPVKALHVAKSVDPANAVSLVGGETFTYTIVLENIGQADYVGDASFTDDLTEVLDDATFGAIMSTEIGGSPAPSPAVFLAPNVAWSGDLAVGQTLTAVYTVVVDNPPGGDLILRNAVLAADSNCETVPDPGCTTQVPQPLLATVKAIASPANPADIGPGDTVTYTITVSNSGAPGATAVNVPVIDNLTDVLDDATFGSVVSTTVGGAPTTPAAFASPTLTWSGNIPAPANVGDPPVSLVITYTVVVKDVEHLGNAHLLNTVQTPDCTDPADVDCFTEADVPGYTIVKSSNPADGGNVRPGGLIDYTITITNTGNVPLQQTVTDDLSGVLDDGNVSVGPATSGPGVVAFDAGNEQIVWNGDTSAVLPVGGVVTITYTIQVLPDTALNQGDRSLLNTVTGTGESNCPAPAPAQPDPDCDVTHPVESYRISKSATPPGPVLPGAAVTYTVLIENTGAVATNPVVTDDIADVLDDGNITTEPVVTSGPGAVVRNANLIVWNPTGAATLAVGGSVEITYAVTVDAAEDLGDGNAANEHGVLNNTVTGTGSSNCLPPDPADPMCSTSTPVEAVRYEKAITTPNVLELQPGDPFTYTVSVTNLGGTPLTGLSFTDDLTDVLDDTGDPTNITVNPPTAGTASFSSPNLVWSLGAGPLAPGAVVTVSYTVTVDDPIVGGDGQMINAVIGTGPDSNCVDGSEPECRTVTPQPVLATAKAVSDPAPGLARAGGIVTYTITVSNTGVGEALAVPVVDDLSDVLDDADFIAGSATATINAATVAAPVFSGGAQTLSWNGNIPAPGTLVITYQVQVHAVQTLDASDGILVNNVDSPGCDADCTTTTAVPAYTITKASDPPEVSTVAPGTPITYTVTIHNTGGVDIVGETITDDASGVLDDAAVTTEPAVTAGPGSATRTGTTIFWNQDGTATLPIDGTVVISYTVTINDADALADGVLANVVTGETPDITNCPTPPTGVPGNPICDTTNFVEAYELSKDSNPAEGSAVFPGQTVTYTVTVTNTGGVAINPTITDDLTDVFDDATLADPAPTSTIGVAPTINGSSLVWHDQVTPIAPQQSAVLTYTVRINDEDALGDFQLGNVVTGDGTNNCPTQQAAGSECRTDHPVGAWDVTKVADADVVVAGDTITYTIRVANIGEADLPGLSFDDDLTEVLDDAPFGNDHSATVGTVSYAAPTLHWQGDLDIGDEAVITYSVTVNGPLSGDGSLYNAVVTPPGAPGSPCPSTPLDSECDVELSGKQLTIAKDTVPSDLASVKPGDTVHYRFTVTNTGEVPYLPATAVDDLGDALDAASGPANISVIGPGNANFDGTSKIIWSGPLTAGETATIEYDLVVRSPFAADGWLENVVTSPDEGANCPTGDFSSTSNECKTATPVQSMRVVKTSDPGNGAILSTGQIITYTINITNTGQAALAPASLTDDLTGVLDDASLEVLPTASSGLASFSSPTITWTGDLAVGASATVTYQMRITGGGDGQLRNVVTSADPGTNCPAGTTQTECVTLAGVLAAPPPTTPATPIPPPAVPTGPGALPATGSNGNAIVQLAVALLGAGAIVLVLSGRRRRQRSS